LLAEIAESRLAFWEWLEQSFCHFWEFLDKNSLEYERLVFYCQEYLALVSYIHFERYEHGHNLQT
jgi:hypothetical protein